MVDSIKAAPKTVRIQGETVALCFFEASTRTRLSFQTASIRMGLGPLVFESGSHTSLEKGETIEDSLLNIAAMMPRLIVVRCGDDVNLRHLASQVKMPLVNAGWGQRGHPTQALLDSYTLYSAWGGFSQKKLLIVGDLKHSRVVASHLELFSSLGLEIGQCGPAEFLLPGSQIRSFSTLEKGLEWADAVMALRFQFERHEAKAAFSRGDYHLEFGLKSSSLRFLKSDGLILHPGPINHGIELESQVLSDPRSRVLEQVSNGVYVREAIMRTILGDAREGAL